MIIGYTLDPNKFIQDLKSMPDKDVNDIILPNELSEQDFDFLMRILKAKHMNDLNDLSDEQLLDLYNKFPLIFPILSGETIFTDNKCQEKLYSLHSTKDARRYLI